PPAFAPYGGGARPVRGRENALLCGSHLREARAGFRDEAPRGREQATWKCRVDLDELVRGYVARVECHAVRPGDRNGSRHCGRVPPHADELCAFGGRRRTG